MDNRVCFMNVATTVIKSRRSIRKFKETPVPEEVVRDALECASLAPTAKNEQPWLFGTVKSRESLKKIADLTDHGKFIADCRLCFAVFAKKGATYYLEDCSAATAQLILGLWAHGVGSCWVAGDKKAYAESVRKLLGVPDSYTLVSLVPAGYPSDVPTVIKRDKKEITFSEQFEHT